MGNTRARPAIYNPATGTYSTAPASNPTALKSKHLTTNTIPAATSAITTPPADIEMLEDDPEADVTAQPKPTLDEDRTFIVRKWALVPAAEADKRPEAKYLADRRPGLRSIYAYGEAINGTAANANGATTSSTLGAVANAAGEEISSTGLELSTVGGIGMGISASAAPIAEPPRKRGPPPPPKRKKKGGVGRRKKVLVDQNVGEQQGQSIVGTDGTADVAGTNGGMAGVKVEDVEGGARDGEEDDDSGSDDGDEGSEEGEIDEGDITMITNLATEAKEPEQHAVEPAVAVAEVKQDEDLPDVEITETEAVAVPVTETAQVEEAVQPATPEMQDLVEEKIPPAAVPEPNDLIEEQSVPAAVVSENEVPEATMPTLPVEEPNVEQAEISKATMPAPPVEEPHVEQAELDLLGSLDRAVEGMQGANADARETAEKPTE